MKKIIYSGGKELLRIKDNQISGIVISFIPKMHHFVFKTLSAKGFSTLYEKEIKKIDYWYWDR